MVPSSPWEIRERLRSALLGKFPPRDMIGSVTAKMFGRGVGSRALRRMRTVYRGDSPYTARGEIPTRALPPRL